MIGVVWQNLGSLTAAHVREFWRIYWSRFIWDL